MLSIFESCYFAVKYFNLDYSNILLQLLLSDVLLIRQVLLASE